MNLRSKHFKHIAVAAGATLMISLFAYAAPGSDSGPANCAMPISGAEHQHSGMPDHGPNFGPDHGPDHGMEHGPGPGAMGMPGGFMQDMPPPPFLHKLNLSEAQQDKIFAILHNSAPNLREQDKQIRKTGDAMRELVDSNNYAEAKMKALADSHGRAIAEMEMIHARGIHQILALLTPEQRKQADALKAKFDEHHVLRNQIREIGNKPDSGSGTIAQ